MSIAGKKIVITSGGTLEKWDQVRGHTNLAKGTMGCYLAREALEAGAEVVYLHGYFATLPQAHPRLQLKMFEGIEDLQQQIKHLLLQEGIDAIIMAAAVSDWLVDKILDQQGNSIDGLGKISSDQPPVIHFKKAPKVITQIKQWKPDIVLVGFKLEHTDEERVLLARARQRMAEWNADFVVANGSGSLYTEKAAHYILSTDDSHADCYQSKEETARATIERVRERFASTPRRSTLQ